MNAEGDMEFQSQASSIKPDAEIYKILSNATLLNKFFRKYNFFFHKISCKQVVVNITYKTGSGFVTTIYELIYILILIFNTNLIYKCNPHKSCLRSSMMQSLKGS